MQAHRHDRYFQMHYLDTGQIELQLDDHRYSVQAPLFVITPPSVPHAFITESDSDGHVLTVHEELIWPLLEVLYPGTRETFGLPGICLSLADKPDELAALAHYWQLIRRESTAQLPGREHTLALLAQAVFTLLLRNARLDDHAASGMRGELKLFQRFNQMIDSHYHQHWTVPDYARELHLTESRLTDICRRFANRSPKRLIFDRQLREAKRLLLFSDSAVNEIAWQLGFKDPPILRAFLAARSAARPAATGRKKYRCRNTPAALRLPGLQTTGRVSAAPPAKSCRDHKIHSRLKSTRRCRKRPFTTSAITASIKQQKQNIYLTLFSDKY
jgi:AraC family 4-hydroxyphenylacetate 3-monooxygenase operon regulatory protein